jgi:biotin carboxylase
MQDKYLFILGGGLLQIAAIEEAHKLGLKTIISDMNDKCVCASLADMFVHLDIFDIKGHLEALRTMQGDGFDIAGVLCEGIDCPETAAHMQVYLGKPTASPEIARICHNKIEFRRAMRVLGYPVPTITKPLIIKTQAESSGSRGTVMYPECEYLVEERMYGSEHTVETLFDVEGRFWPCFITDRHFDYSAGYALEVSLRHPSVLPEYVQRKAYQIAENLGRDLGIKAGPFKLDIMVTEDGVRILEATTRFSGGFDCQYLVPVATGKNILRAGILVAMGEPFSFWTVSNYLNSCWAKIALSESLWPPVGKIVAIEGVEEAKKIKGVEQIFFRKNVGDYVEPYIDCGKRVCFIITSGDTEEEARMAMYSAKRTIKIEVE